MVLSFPLCSCPADFTAGPTLTLADTKGLGTSISSGTSSEPAVAAAAAQPAASGPPTAAGGQVVESGTIAALFAARRGSKDAKYPIPAPTASAQAGSAITQAFLGKRARSGVTFGTPLQTPLSTAPSGTGPTSRIVGPGPSATSSQTTSHPPQPPQAAPFGAAGVSSSSNGFNPFAHVGPQLARWPAHSLGGRAAARAAAAAVRGLSVDDISHAPRRSDREVASDGDASGDDSEPDSAETVGSVESEKYDALVASVGAIADALGAIARVVLVAFPDAARIAGASATAEAAALQGAPPGSGSSAIPTQPSASAAPSPAVSRTSTPMDI